MKTFQFVQSQKLKINLVEAWSFFSSPKNLQKITPTHLNFKILSDVDKDIFNGQIIEYTASPLLGIPIKWVSQISDVINEKQFVDLQTKGPYKYWRHLHTFTEINGGVQVDDQIEYSLSPEVLSPLLNRILVQRKLNSIFDYRRKVLQHNFGEI